MAPTPYRLLKTQDLEWEDQGSLGGQEEPNGMCDKAGIVWASRLAKDGDRAGHGFGGEKVTSGRWNSGLIGCVVWMAANENSKGYWPPWH